jgi:hypothetical protein
MPFEMNFCGHCGHQQSPLPQATLIKPQFTKMSRATADKIRNWGVRIIAAIIALFFAAGILEKSGIGMWPIPSAALLFGYIWWVKKTNRNKWKWIVFPAVAIAIPCVLWNVERRVHHFGQQVQQGEVSKDVYGCMTELNGYSHCNYLRRTFSGIDINLRQCSEQELMAGLASGFRGTQRRPAQFHVVGASLAQELSSPAQTRLHAQALGNRQLGDYIREA